MNHESEQDNDSRLGPGEDSRVQDEEQTGSLQEQIELLKAELEQLQAQTLLERADLENQRKRMTREIESARRFANERLLADMLQVFDSLEAGLASAGAEDPLRPGLELTLRQLIKVTGSFGLTEVAPAPGDAFNPEHHQAMSVAAVAGVPPGAVAQLFQKGYVLNERLLRPAMVVVAPS
ncbi:nucleotide exchange factor GrpE [Luteimonas qiangzhengi]|uniref:nucleotide exchange factor GrpE n=1 Tax=Luteimonas sp. MJ146 TaxID=3129240 RepID=UPI0031B9F43A